MTALEKNIVYFLMAELKEDDLPEKLYTVSVRKLEEAVGKIQMAELQSAAKNLMRRSYHIKKENGNILVVALMGVVYYYDDQKVLKIKISRKILPYFIALKKNYTIFQLDMALSLRSKYAKRIYEMLKYKQAGELKISVEELKYRLALIDKKRQKEVYTEWPTFVNQVLEVAKRELAEKTDISFTYTATKTGKKYTDLRFIIIQKAEQLAS